MEGQKDKAGFFNKNWKVILAVVGAVLLIILFIIFSGKTSVAPDLRYFPT